MADSWSVDAHKTLNVPYDCGIVLCRHRDVLALALQSSGSYLQWSEHHDGMRYTMDMSRRARAVELWAVLRSLGRDGVEGLIDQLCARAQLFAERLVASEFEVLNDVRFNQVLVAWGTSAQTLEILKHLQAGGVCWCSGSHWQERAVIRVSICSHKTSEQDVERAVQAFKDARQRVTGMAFE